MWKRLVLPVNHTAVIENLNEEHLKKRVEEGEKKKTCHDDGVCWIGPDGSCGF